MWKRSDKKDERENGGRIEIKPVKCAKPGDKVIRIIRKMTKRRKGQ